VNLIWCPSNGSMGLNPCYSEIQYVDQQFFSFFFFLFFFLRGREERQRQRERKRILSRLHVQCRAWHRALSHNHDVMHDLSLNEESDAQTTSTQAPLGFSFCCCCSLALLSSWLFLTCKVWLITVPPPLGIFPVSYWLMQAYCLTQCLTHIQ